MTPPLSIGHQRVSRELHHHIYTYLRQTKFGEVLNAPVGVRLGDGDILEPDLVVVLNERADRIGTQVIEGAPDLVVEILSPGSARRDLGVKRELYERHGVTEYWIVDPAGRSIEVLSLNKGRYERTGLFGHNDELHSALLSEIAIPIVEVFPTQ